MEEADKILLDTLVSVGLDLSSDETTFDEFTPDLLINATGLCLEVIFENKNQQQQQSFPKSCPTNMAARYKVGQTLSEALKTLGFKDAIGYQSFLYPNVKDTRKIISFLLEMLPKDTGGATVNEGGLGEKDKLDATIRKCFMESWRSPWLPHYCFVNSPLSISVLPQTLLVSFKTDFAKLGFLSNWLNSFPSLTAQTANLLELLSSISAFEHKMGISEKFDDVKSQIKAIISIQESMKSNMKILPEVRRRTKFLSNLKKSNENADTNEQKIDDDEKQVELLDMEYQKLQSLLNESMEYYENMIEKLNKLNFNIDSLMSESELLDKGITEKTKESDVKEKVGMIVFNDGESNNISKLESAINKRERNIATIEKQWQSHKLELLDKMETARLDRSTKHSRLNQLEAQLQTIKDDMESCRKDYQDKDIQIKNLNEKVRSLLTSDSLKQQNRNVFTKRILELTENKKKQDAEIRKILAEVFLLQKEINSFRGKLERSFLETSNSISVHVKRDEMFRKMGKIVVGIHENCQSLIDVIEEKGRLLREIRDLETNIASENQEDLDRNLNKIVADYEEMKKSCDKLKNIIRQHKTEQA